MNATILHRVTAWFVLALCACLVPALEASAQRRPLPVIRGPVVLYDNLGLQVSIAAGKKVVVGESRVRPPVSVSVAPGYRATFCESAALTARCRRLVGWDGPAPVRFRPPYSAPGTVVTVEKALFGYADLHAHPATHLAWGARGGAGPLWGSPGMSLANARVGNDLPACVSETHSGPISNPLVAAARWGLLQDRGEGSHGRFGAPLFSDWPAAHDILHQQMHVTMLRRAYDGGMRLMVASATDNQMLDIMWNPEFSLSQGRFALREDADYKSAVEQFEFTKRFVDANKSWLAIAKTPAEARKAIESNKLAIVFGLEMDGLSVEEIVALKKKYGVALVTPVHLVNNSFGGAAAYETFFNVANYIMNGSLFGVVNDPSIGFRFPGAPSLYQAYPIVGALLGPISDRLVEYGSTPQGQGHRNRLGIRDEYGLRRLMKTGVLIDVAHMSSQSTDDTLAIALRQPARVPLVYSHGGLRGTQLWGEVQSERGMTLDQLRGLSESGGIFGLGTGEDESVAPPPPMGQWLDRYLEVEQVGNGAIALGTDLNGMAKQIPDTAPSERLYYPSEAIRSADWRGVGRTGALGEFMLGAKVYNFNRDGIAHIGMLPDFLSAVRNQAEFRDNGRQDPQGVNRFTRRLDQVFHSAHDFIASWEQAVRAAPSVDVSLPAVTPASLRLTLETGVDNLKCGNVVMMVMAGSKMVGIHAIPTGLSPHSTYRADIPLLGNTSLPTISKLKIQYANRKCDDFDTGDRWNIKTMMLTYDVVAAGTHSQGVLIHKRGAPAKKLDRGKTWTVSVER